VSTPLEINQSGAGYTWPDSTWDAIWASEGTAPSTFAYPHYFGRACSNLAYPFQQKPIITAFLDAYSTATSEVEESAYAVRDSGLLALAEGDALRLTAALFRAPWQSTWLEQTQRDVILYWSDLLRYEPGWRDVLEEGVPWFFGHVVVSYNQDATVSLWLSDATATTDDLGTDLARDLLHEAFAAGIAVTIHGASGLGFLLADATDLPAAGADHYSLTDSENLGDAVAFLYDLES
jgi:hypothetical protein